MDGHVFEGVRNFRHLGTVINSDNIKSGEIESRISAGNKRFYGLGQFRIRSTSKEVKIQIHKTMVMSVVGYVTDIWCERERWI
jgi:hypothetical protein